MASCNRRRRFCIWCGLGNLFSIGVGMIAILVDKKVTPVSDTLEYAAWIEKNDRTVANDSVNGIRISTVFLGMDHGFGGPSLWFETMIFGGAHDHYQKRYSTWEEAEIGHQKALEMVIGVN